MENEILEGNALIAEFMGKTVYPRTWSEKKKEWIYDKKWKGQGCDYEPFQLKYHEDWNWIMPAVEKIESMNFFFEIARKET